jgi:hypothetical protein
MFLLYACKIWRGSVLLSVVLRTEPFDFEWLGIVVVMGLNLGGSTNRAWFTLDMSTLDCVSYSLMCCCF